MHIVVESLRNSFALLYAHVHQFIMRRLVFDSHGDETEMGLRFGKFWALTLVLCLPLLLRTQGCSNNQLHVNSEARFAESPMETLSLVVLFFLFRWRKFVETRLCSIGVSMRAVLASLGLTRHCTDYDLH